jgi:small subunit ribosomal protein S5e
MHGRNNGKKLKAVTIIKHAMEIIHLLTDQNPVQVIVDAVVNRSVINYILFFFS